MTTNRAGGINPPRPERRTKMQQTKIPMNIDCLWCGKKFQWEPGMHGFCDDCLAKIQLVESIALRLTGLKHLGLTNDIERALISLRQKGEKP